MKRIKKRQFIGVMGIIFLLICTLVVNAQLQTNPPKTKIKARTPVFRALPDLVIEKIFVHKDCHLAVLVKNRGPGYLPDSLYTNPHPKTAGVYVTINGKRWGGQTIPGFDAAKNLKKPGGTATCVLRYKIGTPIQVKAEVDIWNDVKEAKEKNNTAWAKRLSCRRPQQTKKPDLGMYGFLKIGEKKRQVKWGDTIVLTPADSFLVSNGKPAFNVYYSHREYNGVAVPCCFKNKIYFNGNVVSIQSKLSLTAKEIDPIHTQAYLGPENGKLEIHIDDENNVDESREDNNFHFFVYVKFKGF